MALRFARSLGALAADRPHLAPLLVGVGGLLAVGWSAWALRAEVAVHVRSAAAQVVVERGRHDAVVSVEGRVARTTLVLGSAVSAGATLLELEAQDLDLRVRRVDERLAAALSELEHVDAELVAREQVGFEMEASAAAAALEREAGRERLNLAVQLADEQLERKQALSESGGVSDLELSVHRTSRAMAQADLNADLLRVEHAAAEARRLRAEGLATVESLEVRREQLLGAMAQARLDREQIELEREARRVRAPADGYLADASSLPPGSWVHAGQTVATVVDAGPLHVVAQLPYGAAAGRVQVGQAAELELDGFPWSRFGRVPLRVARVATESRDGFLRVELAVDGEVPPALPLEHGLPGTVAVRVDQLSPAELLLRAAGGGS